MVESELLKNVMLITVQLNLASVTVACQASDIRITTRAALKSSVASRHKPVLHDVLLTGNIVLTKRLDFFPCAIQKILTLLNDAVKTIVTGLLNLDPSPREFQAKTRRLGTRNVWHCNHIIESFDFEKCPASLMFMACILRETVGSKTSALRLISCI